MNLRSEAYNALGIEKAANISEAAFSKAMDDAENAKNRRENLWRIFDANRDGAVEFKEVMQALVFFSFDVDKKKKAELQFELFDLNGDGSLSFEEIRHHTTHTLAIGANLIRSTLPSELKRNKDVRKLLNDQELITLAQKMGDALDKADLGNQFTSGLFAAVGKKETDKITKDEYVTFAVEKEDELKSVKLAVAMKLVETIAESAQSHIMGVLNRKIR
jgi:Ca2+-binding EF-hand superfamily protein